MLPLFGVDDNSAYGIAALAALVTATGGVLVQYLSTKQTNKVQNEDRSLNEAWKHVDRHKQERDAAVAAKEAVQDKLNEKEAYLAAVQERVYFLESLLEANSIRVPRRRPADGGTSDSDFHRSLKEDHRRDR